MNAISTLAALVTAVALAGTVCAAFAPRHWIADLAAHFRVQYAVAALLGAAACAFNVAASMPILRRKPGMPATRGLHAAPGVQLRVASVNVFYRNGDSSRVLRLIRNERPDVVVLQEITPSWHRALDALEPDYPHRRFTGDSRSRGVLLLSRWPIERSEFLVSHAGGSFGVSALLSISGRTLRVVGVHACWPMGSARTALRNRQLEQLAELALAEAAPLLIVGDLNVSPFSSSFQRLLEAGGVTSCANGYGWQPTWPSFFPPAGIQIDHVLASSGITVHGFRRGLLIGSDHCPISVDIALR